MSDTSLRKAFVSVTTTIPTRSAFVWWVGEVDVEASMTEAEILDEIMATLIEDKVIRMTKVELEHGAGKERRIVSRSEVILGIGAVATITPLHLTLIEE